MKKIFLNLLFLTGSVIISHAQVIFSTSESCDCVIDTIGLSQFLSTLTLNENIPLRFEVQNQNATFAILHGFIDGSTPQVVQSFIDDYPNVATLVFMQMPGSDNDDANLIAAQNLKNQNYTFYLPSVNAYPQDAFIASGAVDMFFAGKKRIIDVGAEVGVHAWSDGNSQATDFPVGHAFHLPYIDYYVAMGLSQQESEDFYYFTINAAPANGIHFMVEEEIEQYKLRTCKYAESPGYTISVDQNILTANLANANYQWVDCDNGNLPISGATEQSYTSSSSGNFAVQITENNCSGISECQQINLTATNHIQTGSINLYPNPTSNSFYLDVENSSSETLIEITTIEGRLIERIKSNGNEIIGFDNKYSNGIYFVKVTSENVTKTMRLFIQ